METNLRKITGKIRYAARMNKGKKLTIFTCIVDRDGKHDRFAGLYIVDGNVDTVVKLYTIHYETALEKATKKQRNILTNGIPVVFWVSYFRDGYDVH